VERVEDCKEPFDGIGGPVDGCLQPGEDLVAALPQDLVEQAVLASKVAVDSEFRHAGAAGDLLDANRGPSR
jgi:hypothetical protein